MFRLHAVRLQFIVALNNYLFNATLLEVYCELTTMSVFSFGIRKKGSANILFKRNQSVCFSMVNER